MAERNSDADCIEMIRRLYVWVHTHVRSRVLNRERVIGDVVYAAWDTYIQRFGLPDCGEFETFHRLTGLAADEIDDKGVWCD